MTDYREYDFNQNSTNTGSFGEEEKCYSYHNTETTETKEEAPKKKKKNRLAKKIGVTALCGVLLGGTCAGAFIGTLKVTGYDSKLEQAIEASQVKETVAATNTATITTNTTSSSSAGSSTVADIAEEVMPSIVAITNTQIVENDMWSYFFNGGSSNQTVTGAGSGIIIGQNDSELLILTNYHVIEGASSLSVNFIDDNSYDAQVKGTSENNDLAVIAVPLDTISSDTMSQIKIATLGNSDNLRVGDEVIAIGNALGYGQSLTYGHVSALSREVSVDSNKTMTLLQTDAAINPGNSGGALLNMNGEVIGINSAKYSDTDVEGMGFAIPVSEAQDIINDLMNQTTKVAVAEDQASYLGISGVDIDSTSAKTYNMPEGVYVYTIEEGTPAANSELQEKDIITAFEGSEISDMSSLKEQLSYYAGGTQVTLTVQRLNNGTYEEKQIVVTLGYRKDYETSTEQNTQNSRGGQSNQGGSYGFPGQQ